MNTIAKPIRITQHARERIKERFEISSLAEVNRIVRNAYNSGKGVNDLSGPIYDYVIKKNNRFHQKVKYSIGRKYGIGGRGSHSRMRVYSGSLFIFLGGKKKTNILVTAYAIPETIIDKDEKECEAELLMGIRNINELETIVKDNNKKFRNRDELLGDIKKYKLHYSISNKDKLMHNFKKVLNERDRLRKHYFHIDDEYNPDALYDLECYYSLRENLDKLTYDSIVRYNRMLISLRSVEDVGEYYDQATITINNIYIDIYLETIYQNQNT